MGVKINFGVCVCACVERAWNGEKEKNRSEKEANMDGEWESESKEKYSKLWKGRHGSWKSKQNVHVDVDIFPHSLAHNFSCLVLCRYYNGLECLFYLDYSATGPPDVCTSFATIPRTGSKHMSVIFFFFCFLFLAPCWRLFTPTCPHVHFLFLSPTPSPPHGPHTHNSAGLRFTHSCLMHACISLKGQQQLKYHKDKEEESKKERWRETRKELPTNKAPSIHPSIRPWAREVHCQNRGAKRETMDEGEEKICSSKQKVVWIPSLLSLLLISCFLSLSTAFFLLFFCLHARSTDHQQMTLTKTIKSIHPISLNRRVYARIVFVFFFSFLFGRGRGGGKERKSKNKNKKHPCTCCGLRWGYSLARYLLCCCRNRLYAVLRRLTPAFLDLCWILPVLVVFRSGLVVRRMERSKAWCCALDDGEDISLGDEALDGSTGMGDDTLVSTLSSCSSISTELERASGE